MKKSVSSLLAIIVAAMMVITSFPFTFAADSTGKEELPSEPAHAHTMTETRIKEPTCLADGILQSRCTECGYSTIGVLPAYGHSLVTVPGRAPTETEPGLTDGEKCSFCGEITKAQTEIPALGTGDDHVHDFFEDIIDPTCTTPGGIRKTCIECKYYEIIETLPATGHIKEVIPGYPATEYEPGLTDGEKCSACGTILKAQAEIPALGGGDVHEHSFITERKEPTCTEDGYIITKCSCGETKTETLSAFGHNPENVTIPSTCTVQGTSYKICTECDETFDLNVLPLAAHSMGEWMTKTEASCEKDGLKKKVCKNCSYEETEKIPAKGHSLEAVSIPSTCAIQGMTYNICTECDTTYDLVSLPLASHSFGKWQTVKDATCTANGLKKQVCTACNAENTEAIPALGHKETAVSGKNATCTDTGLTEGRKCSVCGTVVLAQKEIPAKGHSFGKWEITKNPTYVIEGNKTRSCSLCATMENQAIARLEAPANEVKDETHNISVKFSDDTYAENVELEVKEEFDGQSFQVLNNEKGNFKSKLFDITTYAAGEKVQPGNGASVLVGIPLPEGYSAEETVIYYVANDGSGLQKMPSYIENGMIWFETTHFSAYAVVDESEELLYTIGDINNDGKITAADARLALRASVGLEKFNETEALAADIDKNKKITAADARMILRASVGLEKLG